MASSSGKYCGLLQFESNRHVSCAKSGSQSRWIIDASKSSITVGCRKRLIKKNQRVCTIEHQIAGPDRSWVCCLGWQVSCESIKLLVAIQFTHGDGHGQPGFEGGYRCICQERCRKGGRSNPYLYRTAGRTVGRCIIRVVAGVVNADYLGNQAVICVAGHDTDGK